MLSPHPWAWARPGGALTALAALTAFGAVAVGCGPLPTRHPPAGPAATPAAADLVALIAAERGPSGARLVALGEDGDRRFELVQPAAAVVRDGNPAVSPDGRWLAFASSRGEPSLETTSVWLAPLGALAVPRRLTYGGVATHPCWTPDGRAVVFASTRAGTFDLWRQPLGTDGRPSGPPERLTEGADHELTPSVGPDGTLAYAALRSLPGGQVESHLELRAPDGAIRRLTDGPADSTPAFSPDGATLAFARPALHNGVPDGELWTMPAAGGEPRPVVDLPGTDETGPVWARDGKTLLATSLLRGAGGAVLFSSVIAVDLEERPPVARALVDRAGAIARLTPAVGPAPLDRGTLRGGPRYLEALVEVMAAELRRRTEEGGR